MPENCSVVIPAFNAARFIQRTIDSVLAQTRRDYEIIVVDDGSTDNTAEVIKTYGSKVRYIYQENAGGGQARNTGITAARYDWIALLDHDDEWFPEKLELQMHLLQRNPDLRWCGANYYKECLGRRGLVGDVEALKKALGDRDYFESFFTAVHQKGCRLTPSTMVIHRQVFEKVGVFGSVHLADIDMWLRIAYRFPKIGYLPQPLAILHLDEQNATLTDLRLASKRGGDLRNLVSRHLELAEEQGCLEEFEVFAKKELRKILITTIYHGFKADARTTVKQFSGLFPWPWRLGAYLLTICPRIISKMAKTLTYLGHKLGLEREISRRWINRKKAKTDNKK